jgi:hypothetical protein
MQLNSIRTMKTLSFFPPGDAGDRFVECGRGLSIPLHRNPATPFKALMLGTIWLMVHAASLSAITFPPTATVPKSALRFLGANQYVEVANPVVFNLPTALTVEAWVNVSTFDKSYQAIVTKGDAWGLVRSGSTGRISFRTRSAGTFHEVISAANLANNVWVHIAGVYDGTNKFLYINGVLSASAPYSSVIDSTTFPLQFGNNAEAANRLFKGQLDTVRVWSTARTLPQIWADIDRDLRGNEAGLLGEWRFNEASGNTALDSSTGLRHGTLFNMVDADRVDGIQFRPPPPLATLARNAIRFEGDERQFVAVESQFENQFDLSGTALTLEAWVNITAFDKPSQAIISKGESWAITRSGNTSKVAFHTKSGGTVNDLVSVSDLLPNRWYHVAAVYAGAQKLLLIDGILESTVAYSTTLALNDFPVLVGGNAETAGRGLNGRVDNVRIWSVARTTNEVAVNMLRNLRGNESGLLAEWRFDEPSGAKAFDSSFAERNATLVNLVDANRVEGLAFQIAPPPVATVANGALRFTGGAGANAPRVEITDEAPFDLYAAMTLEAWVNITAFDLPWQAIVSKGEAWGITRVGETNRIAFRTGLVSGPVDLESSINFETNKWYHLAVVFDGVQKRLYINGVLDASAAFSGPLLENNFKLAFGGNTEQADRGFKGQLEAVRVWSEPRTVEEIRAQIDRDLRGNESGLLGEWRFNEASGATANDSSQGAHPGTLLNMNTTSDRVAGFQFRDPADGELGLAFVQTGAKQFISLPDQATFDLQNQLTVECWVYIPAFPAATAALVSKGQVAWQLLIQPSGRIQFTTPGVTHSDATADLVSDRTIPIGEWHHVAATWSFLRKEKVIYIDGLKDVSESNLTGSLTQNDFPVLIASEPTSSGSPPSTTANFSGRLDEVRIWSSARTEDHIRDNVSRYLNGTEPGLIGVWSFNEGSGSVAFTGKTASTLNGTLAAAMNGFSHVEGYEGLGAPLAPQAALSFNGIDEYVEIPHQAALNLPPSATIEAWIKPTGTGLRTILFKGAEGYGLALDENNRLRYFVDSLPANALQSTRILQSNVWQHVAVVIDGTARTTTFYVDGQPAGTFSRTNINNNLDSLFLGKRGGSAPSFYSGQMDDVRLWTTARSSVEINLYAFQQLPFNATGLAAYWAFNEGSSTVLKDGTLNRITGTLQNMDGSNWDQGQVWPVPALEGGVALTLDPNSRGLWIGQVVLNKVNEVQAAINGAAETTTPTADSLSLRVLLHVNAGGQVRLLKDVTVMESLSDPNNPNSGRTVVLVTDPARLPEFQGVATRFGKRVGIRYGSVSFDFPGDYLPLLGGVGPGVGCVGSLSLPADHVTNPFKHRYHPEHREGFDVARQITFKFDGSAGASLQNAPGYGVQSLSGTYKETITGLHKIPLKVEGTVVLNRISQVDKLDNRN